MIDYVENDCVLIYRTRDPFGEFSNMHNDFPIQHGRKWLSSEGLYQALRYPGEAPIHDAINAASNAFMAKRAAYEFIEQTRSDWHEQKVTIMEMVLRLKLSQHFDRLSALLMQCGDRPIVEKSLKDDFWGAIPDGRGNLIGANVLGLLWMVMGAEVREGTFHADVSLSL